jgi:hypothetical protein
LWQVISAKNGPGQKSPPPCIVCIHAMNTPAAPDSLACFDLVLDHELWQRLKGEAEQRGSDLGAYVSWLLMRQVQTP